MTLSDTVKIVVVVISPIIFFTLLFLGVLLYRRYHLPSYREGVSAKSTDLIQGHPSGPENELPHFYMGSGTQALGERQELFVDVEEERATSQNGDAWKERRQAEGSISQPHFVEKAISIRRLNNDPDEPDVISRVNSLTSTLTTQVPAKASSDLLPYGDRRQTSHTSSVHPSMVGNQGIEANCLAVGVIAVGDRRPSVLSGGLFDRGDSDTFSVRKVSAGGAESWIEVKPAGIDPAKLPINTDPEQVKPESRHLSTLIDQLELEEYGQEVPSNHPFSASAGSNSRDHIVRASIPLPILHVPTMLPPPNHRNESYKRHRPDSLTLATSSVKRKTTDESLSLPSAQPGPSTSISVVAIKSAPLAGPMDEENISSGSDYASSIFEAWKGFPPKVTTAKAVLIHPPSPQHPQNTFFSTQATSSFRSNASPRTVPDRPPGLIVQTGSLAPPASGTSISGASPSSQRQSKITYLADVVKEDEERRRSSMISATITSAPSSAAIQPPTPVMNMETGLLKPPRETARPSAEVNSDSEVILEIVREDEVKVKSAKIIPASPMHERPRSVHLQFGSLEGSRRSSIVAEDPPVISPLPWQGRERRYSRERFEQRVIDEADEEDSDDGKPRAL